MSVAGCAPIDLNCSHPNCRAGANMPCQEFGRPLEEGAFHLVRTRESARLLGIHEAKARIRAYVRAHPEQFAPYKFRQICLNAIAGMWPLRNVALPYSREFIRGVVKTLREATAAITL